MSILILADHDDGQLAAATLNTVTAAREIGGDIHILVAGDASGSVASAAAAAKLGYAEKTPALAAANCRNSRRERMASLPFFGWRSDGGAYSSPSSFFSFFLLFPLTLAFATVSALEVSPPTTTRPIMPMPLCGVHQ